MFQCSFIHDILKTLKYSTLGAGTGSEMAQSMKTTMVPSGDALT
jgi:hypothetical protein